MLFFFLREHVLTSDRPGEVLPPFPRPTHAPGTVSVQKTLEEVDAADRASPLPYHHPKPFSPLSEREPYDPDCLAKTVTCKGGENYHPSGKRRFTVQEFLALQTFPFGFRFPKTRRGRPFPETEMKAQIGNAVPRLFGKAMLESVVKSLRAQDERRLADF